MSKKTFALAADLESFALAAGFESALRDATKTNDSDPLVIACLEMSNLTLDLVWAMQWIDTLTDRLGEDGMVGEFMQDLEERIGQSKSLELAAREANLP